MFAFFVTKEALTTTHWLQFACAPSPVTSDACRSFRNPVCSEPCNREMSYAEPCCVPPGPGKEAPACHSRALLLVRVPMIVPRRGAWWGNSRSQMGKCSCPGMPEVLVSHHSSIQTDTQHQLKVKTLQKTPVKGSGVRETPGMRRELNAQPWDPGVRLSDSLALTEKSMV